MVLFLLAILISWVGYLFEFYLAICLGILLIVPLPILPIVRHSVKVFTENSTFANAEIIELKKERIFTGIRTNRHFFWADFIFTAFLALITLFRETNSFKVVFQFNDDYSLNTDKLYLLEADVKEDLYEGLNIGGSIKVRYLNSDPLKVVLQGEIGFSLGSHDDETL